MYNVRHYRQDDVKAIVVLHNHMFVTLRQLSTMEMSILEMLLDDVRDNCMLSNDKLQSLSSMPLSFKCQLRGDLPDDEGSLRIGDGKTASVLLDELLQFDAVLHS